MQDVDSVAVPACPFNKPGDFVRDKNTAIQYAIDAVFPCPDAPHGACNRRWPRCTLVVSDPTDASTPASTRVAHEMHNESDRARESWERTPVRANVGRPRSPRKSKMRILVDADLLDWASSEHVAGRLDDPARLAADVFERIVRHWRSTQGGADPTNGGGATAASPPLP